MDNRRNYYRILQVQPDAPQALIVASYRTLMQKLRYHPDLGGDHWNAALLNEAFQVLSDPEKRKAYDAAMGDRLFNFRRGGPRDSAGAEHRGDPPRRSARPFCPFCGGLGDGDANGDEPFCADCRSPLRAVEMMKIHQQVRRITDRVALQADVHYYTAWPQTPRTGRLCNISPTGLALSLPERLPNDSVIKIESMLLNAIATVVHAHPGPEPGRYSVGVKLLTAAFNLKQGTFVNLEI